LRRVKGLQEDEIDANGSSIPFLLNHLDRWHVFLAAFFGLRFTVHPAFQSSGQELHSSFTSFKRDKITGLRSFNRAMRIQRLLTNTQLCIKKRILRFLPAHYRMMAMLCSVTANAMTGFGLKQSQAVQVSCRVALRSTN
jgi:hypothetical protein